MMAWPWRFLAQHRERDVELEAARDELAKQRRDAAEARAELDAALTRNLRFFPPEDAPSDRRDMDRCTK